MIIIDIPDTVELAIKLPEKEKRTFKLRSNSTKAVLNRALEIMGEEIIYI